MLERRIKDPRLGFVTVTDVRVTGDTQQATSSTPCSATSEDEARRHRRRARVGQGAAALRGRQAARHAARAVADVHPRRAARDRPAPRRGAGQGPRRPTPRRPRRRGATYAGEARPVQEAARGRRRDERRRARRAVERRPAAAGLVVVDKPGGMTSHDVVARVRRLAGTRKVGHAGTLDPMATGVLVLGVNRATRLLGHLMLTEKAYDATIRLGVATTTDDAEGEADRGRRPRRASTRRPSARRWPGSSATSSRCRPRSRRSRSTASAPTQRVRAGEEVAAEGAAGDRPRARRARRTPSGGPDDGSTSTSRSAAPAAPTSGRSPATSAPGSASAAT